MATIKMALMFGIEISFQTRQEYRRDASTILEMSCLIDWRNLKMQLSNFHVREQQ